VRSHSLYTRIRRAFRDDKIEQQIVQRCEQPEKESTAKLERAAFKKTNTCSDAGVASKEVGS
jgi:hypothetical protein